MKTNFQSYDIIDSEGNESTINIVENTYYEEDETKKPKLKINIDNSDLYKSKPLDPIMLNVIAVMLLISIVLHYFEFKESSLFFIGLNLIGLMHSTINKNKLKYLFLLSLVLSIIYTIYIYI